MLPTSPPHPIDEDEITSRRYVETLGLIPSGIGMMVEFSSLTPTAVKSTGFPSTWSRQIFYDEAVDNRDYPDSCT
jgi:hypothetical protein